MLLLLVNISLLVVTALLLIVLLLQPIKSDGSLNSFDNGGVRVFSNRKKVHGVDLVLKRVTVVLLILFFVLNVAHMFI